MSGIFTKRQLYRRQICHSKDRNSSSLSSTSTSSASSSSTVSISPSTSYSSLSLISSYNDLLKNDEIITNNNNNIKNYQKKIIFNESVDVILIPSIIEYTSYNLIHELWWCDKDFQKFKLSAYEELNQCMKFYNINDIKEAIKILYLPPNCYGSSVSTTPMSSSSITPLSSGKVTPSTSPIKDSKLYNSTSNTNLKKFNINNNNFSSFLTPLTIKDSVYNLQQLITNDNNIEIEEQNNDNNLDINLHLQLDSTVTTTATILSPPPTSTTVFSSSISSSISSLSTTTNLHMYPENSKDFNDKYKLIYEDSSPLSSPTSPSSSYFVEDCGLILSSPEDSIESKYKIIK